MAVTLHLILMILAVVLLLLATLGISAPRVNLLAAGLLCWALAILIGTR